LNATGGSTAIGKHENDAPMTWSSLLHLVLHAAVPGAVALLFFRPHGKRAWLIMLSAMAVDLDHLLADPVYDQKRCGIGFHPPRWVWSSTWRSTRSTARCKATVVRFTAVMRPLKAALLLLLLALVPLRGIAAVTGDSCAARPHAGMQAAAECAPALHHQALETQGDNKAECTACGQHCPGPAFLIHGVAMPLPGDASASDRLDPRAAADFVPEHLDPPPLAF